MASTSKPINRNVTPGDIKRYLDDALRTVDIYKRWIAAAPYLQTNTKAYLMCVFMHASLDYSRAMLKLLRDDPVGFCAVGPALLRPQIETFIRAGWIYFNAEEAQVTEFLRNDKLRRRKHKEGQRVSSSNPFNGENLDDFLDLKNTMSISAIAQALKGKLREKGLEIDLAAYVEREDRMPNGLWAGLNGLLHGGNILLKLYMADDSQLPTIGTGPQFTNTVVTTSISVDLAFKSAGLVGHAVCDNSPTRKEALVNAMTTFRSRHDALMARLTQNLH